MRRIAVMLSLVAVLAPAGVARAATLDIDVRSNFFAPDVARPAAGDTVRWTVRNGFHNVVAYAGEMSFASELMNSSDPPYTQTYTGGEVLYLCSPHSSINEAGICSGMCAVLSDRTVAPGPPSVSNPPAGSTVPSEAVTFAGTAEPWTVVRIFEGNALLTEALAGQNGAWSTERFMPAGAHSVTVRADGADGTQGGQTSLAFTVAGDEDTTPPEIEITSGKLSGGAGRAGIFGYATDAGGVAEIRVRARDLHGAVVVETTADCLTCGEPFAEWWAEVALPVGVWTLEAVAKDVSGNVSAPAGPVYAVIGPG